MSAQAILRSLRDDKVDFLGYLGRSPSCTRVTCEFTAPAPESIPPLHPYLLQSSATRRLFVRDAGGDSSGTLQCSSPAGCID